nr:ribonuclease M5 [Tissierella sp.]
MIKEVIVVEGKDDVAAVKAALDAEIIITNGFNYGNKLIKLLNQLQKRQGIIIFTDPDFMGEKIRRDIASKVKGCKHAFLPQDKSTRKDDIGIENAKPQDIIEAIAKAKPIKVEIEAIYGKDDMIFFGLVGKKDSKNRRDKLGHELGIGYGNGKQFLSRLNNFGVSKEEFIKAIERIEEDGEGK